MVFLLLFPQFCDDNWEMDLEVNGKVFNCQIVSSHMVGINVLVMQDVTL